MHEAHLVEELHAGIGGAPVAVSPAVGVRI